MDTIPATFTLAGDTDTDFVFPTYTATIPVGEMMVDSSAGNAVPAGGGSFDMELAMSVTLQRDINRGEPEIAVTCELIPFSGARKLRIKHLDRGPETDAEPSEVLMELVDTAKDDEVVDTLIPSDETGFLSVYGNFLEKVIGKLVFESYGTDLPEKIEKGQRNIGRAIERGLLMNDEASIQIRAQLQVNLALTELGFGSPQELLDTIKDRLVKPAEREEGKTRPKLPGQFKRLE